MTNLVRKLKSSSFVLGKSPSSVPDRFQTWIDLDGSFKNDRSTHLLAIEDYTSLFMKKGTASSQAQK